jgi:hypothetical protein
VLRKGKLANVLLLEFSTITTYIIFNCKNMSL